MVLAEFAFIGQLGQGGELRRRDLRVVDTFEEYRRGALMRATQQMPDLMFQVVGAW